MAVTARNLITDALIELGSIGPEETPDAANASWMLKKLNRLLNNWNAQREAVYVESFLDFTLVPNLQPHTIGPSGATYTVTQRPVVIDGANLILNNVVPNVRCSITLRDWQWWQQQSVQTLVTSITTDLYYAPEFPTGKLFFWPVPNTAYGVELVTRMTLNDALGFDDALAMPPGYQDAITLTLAENSATSQARPMPPQLPLMAANARARIFAVNYVTPHLITQDAGMPSSAPRHSNWNYLTGMDSGSSNRG